jgi:broad specificity phosphatase PhoE
MTVVHLLRHGEVHNPDRVLYGRLPGFGLSQRGHQQAEIAAKYLAAFPVGHVVSSPLQRARETAEPLIAALGLPLAVDDRLIEAENALEGTRVTGALGLLSNVANWRYFTNPVRPSWGEPYRQIADRMLAAVRDAADVAAVLAPIDGQPAQAVCVSHQLPIYTVRRFVEGQRLYHDPRRRECALASVTTLTLVEHVVVRVEYTEPAGATPADSVAGA